MKFATLILGILISFTTARISRPVRYDNQLLVRIYGSNDELRKKPELRGVDVFSRGRGHMTVRMTREQWNRTRSGVKKYEIVNQNIQEAIDAETRRLNSPGFTAEWFDEFHTYEDIVKYLKSLADKFPQVVKFKESVGKTVEGRDIPLITVTGRPRYNKPVIYVQAMQHAREWIASSTTQFIATSLASGYQNDTEITQLLDNVEFAFVPVSNPDGYVYTWTTDRLWRKNRALVNGTALGVDTNRNYPDHWDNSIGASTDPEKLDYRGPYPMSEPETRALVGAFNSFKPRVIGAIDFHAYSQLILRPSGWTNDTSVDEEQFLKVGEIMRKEIQSVNGTVYESIRSIDLYPISGAASDWFYGNSTKEGERRKYAFAMELSPIYFDPNKWGFNIPPSQIIPVGKETLKAFLAYAKFAYENPLPVK